MSRFLVAFLIPAAIILIYQRLASRARSRAELEARLDAERRLSQAREEFIANASHELRTPLTGIHGLAMLLVHQGGSSEVTPDPPQPAVKRAQVRWAENLDRGQGRRPLLQLVVADNGSGLPKELEGKVFQRFIHQNQQTAVKDSVGLGLSIVRALADGMSGSVEYERSEGETRFVVTLPLADIATTGNPFDELLPGEARR